jgi:hypothetical protein
MSHMISPSRSTHVSAQDHGETDALYQAQSEGHGHLYSQGTQKF